MKRSPITRHTSLTRGPGPKRRTRLNPYNSARRSRLRAETFSKQAELARTLPCCCCNAPPPSDPAHVRSRGAGGKDRANVVPLARACHMRQHAVGWRRFWEERGMPADHAERVARILEREAYGEESR